VGASGSDHCLPTDGVDDLDEEGGEEELFEDDIEYLKSLDPKEWKTQDHYRVLGLTTKRIKASEDDIKRACKQKSHLTNVSNSLTKLNLQIVKRSCDIIRTKGKLRGRQSDKTTIISPILPRHGKP
jgi:hypothetical protein